MNVTSCYKLTERVVESRRLMLDPNNPRLSLGWSAAKKYSPSQLKSADLQEKVFDAVLKGKHRVKELIHSISAKGFVRGAQPLIVKPIADSGDFLVLEGNRRVAAIRYLMGRDKVNGDVRASIVKIPVQVFEYVKGSAFSEEEVVDVLLGTIHIEGPEEWGAMEKAYYVFRSYVRELKRKHNAKVFQFDKDIAKTLADNYGLTMNKLKNVLAIYLIFQQLRGDAYEVNADDYSLIEMAITCQAARDKFFLYDGEKLKMPSVGRERFSQVCLERDAPIKNPSEFRAFSYVLENGTEYEVAQIVEERKSPLDVKAITRQRALKRVFVEKLEAIKQHIESLKPADFRDTNEENNLIASIKKLVDGRLVALTNGKFPKCEVDPIFRTGISVKLLGGSR